MPAHGAPDRLVVGHISKPHGTKGEIFVWPLTDRPEAVFADGRALEIGEAADGARADGARVDRGGDSGGAGVEAAGDDAGSAASVEPPDRLTFERTRPFERGLLLTIERTRPFKRGLLLKVEGLNDRSAVEPLAGRYLLAPIESLDALEEDEVFYHQLLDAEVVTTGGEVVGTVQEVYETEPAHLLEVRSEAGALHLVPFSKRIVKSVDGVAGRIVIDPPPGLLEL